MISNFVKSFFVSKTIAWATLLSAFYMILTAFGMDTKPDDVNILIATIEEMLTSADGLLVLANNVVAIGLRWMTKKPIQEKL
jgi:hypothetical protein